MTQATGKYFKVYILIGNCVFGTIVRSKSCISQSWYAESLSMQLVSLLFAATACLHKNI